MAKAKKKKTAALKPERKTAGRIIERDIEAAIIIIIGLFGILGYFGWVNLGFLNWSLLSPVILLALGLLMLSGLIDRFAR